MWLGDQNVPTDCSVPSTADAASIASAASSLAAQAMALATASESESDDGATRIYEVNNIKDYPDYPTYTFNPDNFPVIESIPVTFTPYTINIQQRSGAPAAPQNNSEDPIRYFDGAVDYSTTDLTSGSLGDGFTQSRSWTNNTQWSANQRNGNGWISDSVPMLTRVSGDSVIAVVQSAMDIESFVLTDGEYEPTSYVADNLAHIDGEFIFTDSAGNAYHFYDFSSSTPAGREGQFKSMTNAGGLLTYVASWTSDGAIEELRRQDADGNDAESWLYSYLGTSDPNAGLLSSVQTRQADGQGGWTLVQQVVYQYYNGTDSYGNLGDLKTASTQDDDGNVLGTTYYRYYTTDGSDGYVHGLKYVFDEKSYARLCEAVDNPFVATDAQVAPYAQHYFEYDRYRRTTVHSVQAWGGDDTDGIGTFTYSYVTSDNASDVNSWRYKTIETLPDGNQNILYSNCLGQVMLKVFNDVTGSGSPSGQQQRTYYQYDSLGRLILQAEPSAVTGYDESSADLLVDQSGNYQYLADAAGTVYVYQYGASTTATATTAGDVEGLFKTATAQQGELGSGLLLETTDYFVNTYASRTTVVVANDTVYTDGTTATAETTSYAYTWHTDTVAILSMTATLPAVLRDNTPTHSVYEYEYNLYGQVVQATDALDVVTVYTRDTLGQVTETVENYVDGQYSASSPSEDVATSYAYDALGRVTKMTDALGNVTYYVYDDVAHEIRIYAGWNATTNNTLGAITVYREDLSGNYTETLSYTWTDPNGLADYLNADGSPTGAESLTSSYVVLQSLSRSLLNSAGQVVAVRDYFNLAGLAYSTSLSLGAKDVNYAETGYGYGPWGDTTSFTDACGNTTTYAYDSQGNVVAITDALNNATTYQYDSDGNRVSVTDALGVTTTSTYNYLGRVIAVCQNYVNGVYDATDDADEDVITSYTYDVLGNLLTLTDAEGNTTTYTYDALGRVVQETNELAAR